MEPRDRLLLSLGLAAAAAAAGAAILFGPGPVDRTGDPPPPPPFAHPGAGNARRDLPPLVLPAGTPPEAAAVLAETRRLLVEGSDAEGRAALRALESPSPGGPVAAAAPLCLRAVAPLLVAIVAAPDDPLAGPATAAAVGLARAGGPAGRAALTETGFVARALALQAGTGPPGLRVEAARLLGLVGGAEAVDWLAYLMARAGETEVREAAVHGLASAFLVERPAGPAPLMAVRAVMEDPATPEPVLVACIHTVNRAWTWFEPYGVEGAVIAGLSRPATRYAAAKFLDDHPLEAAAPAVLAAARTERDPRILEHLAEALGALRPEGAAEVLEGTLPWLTDARARETVEKALRRIRGR